MSDVLKNGKPERKIRFTQQRDDPAGVSYELTAMEIDAIREKARLTVENEIKDRKERALYDQFLDEMRTQNDPEQQLVPCFVELAAHCSYIMLDGTQFHHGRLYHVTPQVFAVLVEQMARGFAHEEETEVRDARSKRRQPTPRHIGIGNFVDNRQPRNMSFSAETLAGINPTAVLGLGA